ncbi:MAG: urea transporter [Chitinophagaceae bacterium]|nr:urea transporter [Chitinophagaceae bacterium]
MLKQVKNIVKPFAEEVLNSYSILLFSGSRALGLLLLIVSFFKPYAGFAGLVSAIVAIGVISFAGLQRSSVHKGLYSYNAVLIGIGMGTFYNPGTAFWLLLFLAVLFSVIMSGVLARILLPRGLPFLTIPFVICFWLVILVSREFTAIDFSTRNIYWLNEMYAIGDKDLVNFMMFFENLPLPALVLTFFKSLSSLFFQENVLAGMIIFTVLLFHSRIALTLLVLGFIAGFLFNGVVHAYDSGINYYLMGGNFIIVTLAIGSFFTIPSLYSYLWALVAVPITFIMVIALGKLTALLNLPVYSLPFCIVTILMIYFFSLLKQSGKLVITPLQFYSPEKNLYNFLNARKRLFSEKYYRLQLPFLGQWIVSQGYDSDITHKGDWSKALDFMIVDSQMKTYTEYALKPENFYCYNKPVLAPAAGYVQEIIDHIEDNEIGKINREQNWGNTIVIRHAEGLYTKMSHLRRNSFKVNVGDYVHQGDVVAACGNSGRSPEPHLHFQVQSTPYVGSKTLAYPFEAMMVRKDGSLKLAEFEHPAETAWVSHPTVNESLASAFEFLPGYRMEVSAEGFDTSTWEIFTDAYNLTYFYCHQTGAIAYFTRTACFFYFTSFYGNRKSLLYQFYLGCYKISLSTEYTGSVQDEFPLQWTKNNPGKWLQDFIAPFYIFRRLLFESSSRITGGGVFDAVVTVESKRTLQYPGFRLQQVESTILIEDKKIKTFSFEKQHKKITVTCTSKG